MLYTWCLGWALFGSRPPVDLYRYHPAEPGAGWAGKTWHYVSAQPWVGFIMVMCFFHLTWVYMLLAAQVFQVRSHDCHTQQLEAVASIM